VRGEGVIARFGPNAFELSSAVRDFAWIADGRGGFDVKVTNATGARAVIGVRGPRTAELLVAAGLSAEGASEGSVVRPSWRPAHVAMMRDAAGDGLELWMQSDDGAVVWDKLWRAGAVLGVAGIGATTLEVARIDAAVARPGVDWRPAQLAHDPAAVCIPADLGVATDPARRFNGGLALRRAKGRGQVLVQVTSDTRLPLGPIAPKTSGMITSSAWSESRACAVALAWLDRDGARPGTPVQLQGGLSAEVTREVFATRP
jgi:glycine cleavage system aminomethyltransferase T